MPSSVCYSFSLSNAAQNFVDIHVTMPTSDSSILVHVPSWRPGRYELGNFSKNIRCIVAHDKKKRPLHVRKVDRNSWEINGIEGNEIYINYQYYANELNAGSTYTDGTYLYVNPVNCALYSLETCHLACEIALDIPEVWKVAGIRLADGKFTCTNFDKLADSPFIASPFLEQKNYSVGESNFIVWFHQQQHIPWEKVINDFTKFSEKLISAFGELPAARYEFMILSLPFSAYHGVEHLESTVITLGPSYEIFGSLYTELLGVSCHELYHVWNVKSIRPIEMLPYDFSRENYSQLGFIYEGITTYFGDLFLVKSGVFSPSQYLKELSEQFQKHMDNFGRRNYSLADSSIDTWVDGYVPGIPERKISIYTEGCLFAFYLDLSILNITRQTKNLQSVMTLLFQQYAKQNKGIDFKIFCQCITEICGIDLSDKIGNLIFKPTDFIHELKPILDQLGLELSNSIGNVSEKLLGVKTLFSNGNYLITSLHPDGTAFKHGMRVGDEIYAINKIKIKGDLEKWIAYFGQNPLIISILRNGKLFDIEINEFSTFGFEQIAITPKTNITQEQIYLFDSWLGLPKGELIC